MVIQARRTNPTSHKPKFDVSWPCSNASFMSGEADGSDPSIFVTLPPSLTPDKCDFKVSLICLASAHVPDYGLAFPISVMVIPQLFKTDEHLRVPGQPPCSYKVKLILTGLLALNKDSENVYATIASWAIASQKTEDLFSLCVQVVSKNPDQSALGTFTSLITCGISEQWMPRATDTLVAAVNAHNKVAQVPCTPMTPAATTTTASSSTAVEVLVPETVYNTNSKRKRVAVFPEEVVKEEKQKEKEEYVPDSDSEEGDVEYDSSYVEGTPLVTPETIKRAYATRSTRRRLSYN